MKSDLYLNRSLNIYFLNASEKIVDIDRIVIEKRIHSISSELNIHTASSLDEIKGSPCDLLIISAIQIPLESFSQWLTKLSQKIQNQGFIWVPALIISGADFTTLGDVLSKAVQMNWYFDVVNQQHLDSIPIRVANLLRIHDHLHELDRYEEALNKMNEELLMLQNAVNTSTQE